MRSPFRSLLALALVVLPFGGCRREVKLPPKTVVRTTTAPIPVQDLKKAHIDQTIPIEPVFLQSSAIGSTAAADGTVTGEQREFRAGQPIHLMMRFTKSPEALEASIRFLDGSKNLVYGDMHAMKGAMSVTFTIPPGVVRRGHYTVQGYWGGNLACEYPVEVK